MNSNSLGTCNPIKKHGDALMGEFTQVSNALARDGELSAEAFRVYLLLLSHDEGYRESAVKIAARYGWGKQRAKNALRELVDARLLVIQRHLTERGTRAFEEYHLHTTGRFTDAEVDELSQPVGWSKSDQVGWSNSDQVLGPDQTKGVGPNQTNKEYKAKHQEKTNTEDGGYVSDADVSETLARIEAFANEHRVAVLGEGDPWDGYGDTDE